MMDGHSLLAVELSGGLREALSGAQASAAALSEGARLLPRRYLQLPLEDLGPCTPEVLEAVQLAVERTLRLHAPFSVALRGLRTLGEPAALIVAGVEDPDGRLAALRADLHARLEGYGFPLVSGVWTPHVPLAAARTVGDLKALSALPLGRLRVQRVSLLRRDLYDRRSPRFRSTWSAPLQGERRDAPPAEDADAAHAHIADLLEERLRRNAEQTQHPLPRPRRRPRRDPAQGDPS